MTTTITVYTTARFEASHSAPQLQLYSTALLSYYVEHQNQLVSRTPHVTSLATPLANYWRDINQNELCFLPPRLQETKLWFVLHQRADRPLRDAACRQGSANIGGHNGTAPGLVSAQRQSRPLTELVTTCMSLPTRLCSGLLQL